MKNHLKKLLITFTLIIGLCGSVLATPAAAAAIPQGPISVSASNTKKIELNTGEILFYVGGVYDLRLKNATAKNVKWKTSNKAIATVNSKGRITAKKIGQCYIIAKYRGKQYKCKVTVLSDNRYLKTWCKMLAKLIKSKKLNKSPYNQVLAATSFVAKNFDYGSAKTPLDVLKKGRGTCVSANKLLVELLKALGFKAEIRFAGRDKMSRYPKGIMFMNHHHNVKVVIKGTTYYVDGTPATGAFYMTTSKKPIYYEIYYGYGVIIDYVPGHKHHFNLQ